MSSPAPRSAPSGAVGSVGAPVGSGIPSVAAAAPARPGSQPSSAPAGPSAGSPAGIKPASAAAPRSGGTPSARSGATPAAPRSPSSAVPPADAGRRARATRRPPRLASLQLKRVDPWTVLKISLIVSIVMFFVWMIAVGVLYLSLGSMDVWSKINSTYNTLVASSDTTTPQPDLITPTRVFGVTAVVGAVNIVLFTALATIAAFVYNAAAGMAGGVEITLGERD